MNHKRFTVAVVGATDPTQISQNMLEFAEKLGAFFAEHGMCVATGAVNGFGLWAAMGAVSNDGFAIGFSPASNAFEHEHHFRLPLDYHSTIVFTGFGYLGRDVVLARSVDAVVVGLGDKDAVHEILLSTELQKPLLVVNDGHNEDSLAEILGDMYRSAEIHESFEGVAQRLQELYTTKK